MTKYDCIECGTDDWDRPIDDECSNCITVRIAVAAERERIVKWLRAFLPDTYSLLDDAADMIEDGAQ